MDVSLKERLLPLFPLARQGILVRPAQLCELLRLSQECKEEERARMTCRPLSAHPAGEAGLRARMKQENTLLLGVFVKEQMVGRISLSDYNARNLSAELGYWASPHFRGEGYMARGLFLLCEAALLQGGLGKLYAQTGEFNKASIGLLQGLGFQLDGRLRQHHELDGSFYDDYIFSLLSSEFCTERGDELWNTLQWQKRGRTASLKKSPALSAPVALQQRKKKPSAL